MLHQRSFVVLWYIIKNRNRKRYENAERCCVHTSSDERQVLVPNGSGGVCGRRRIKWHINTLVESSDGRRRQRWLLVLCIIAVAVDGCIEPNVYLVIDSHVWHTHIHTQVNRHSRLMKTKTNDIESEIMKIKKKENCKIVCLRLDCECKCCYRYIDRVMCSITSIQSTHCHLTLSLPFNFHKLLSIKPWPLIPFGHSFSIRLMAKRRPQKKIWKIYRHIQPLTVTTRLMFLTF